MIDKLIAAAVEQKIKEALGVKSEQECLCEGTKIAILDRGWVVVGKYSTDGDFHYIDEGAVIRNWGTTKGLGEIAENGPTESTKLDKCPKVSFKNLVALIDCSESKWKNKLK